MSAAHDKTVPSILIVEDEIMVAMHLSMVIESLGYRLAGIAVDKESALKYREGEFDIALVDCNLRDGLTGPDIGRHLAANKKAAVVFITANPHHVLAKHVPQEGILGIYPKPVNDNDVGDIVAFALSKREGNTDPRVPLRLYLL
jgi:two-component system, response regulator PdtaR